MRILDLAVVAALVAPTFAAGSGSTNPKLSGPMVAEGNVINFKVGTDGMTVVYIASQDTAGVTEVYAVPIDGSTSPVKISGPVIAGAGGIHLWVYAISPDNDWVAFSSDRELPGSYALYSAPIDGSAAPTLLHRPGFCSVDDNACETTAECPDVGHCVGGGESCETDTDCPGMLNSCLDVQSQTCYARTFDPAIDPMSAHVVYLVARVFSSAPGELYSVPIDASGPPVKISASLPEGIREFEIAFAGDRVVFQVDHTYKVGELYSAPIDGSEAPVKLNAELVAGGGVSWYEISPDGTEVLYLADQETDEFGEIYIVPIDGSATPEKLSDPMVGAVQYGGALSHDGTRLIYRLDAAGSRAVYSVPIDGSAPPIKLSHTLDPGDTGWTVSVSPDSPWVVYLTMGDGFDYYSVTVDGSAGPHLLQAANEDDHFVYVRERRLIYLYQPSEGDRDFRSVPLDGSQPPVPLGGGVFYSVGPNMGPDFFVYAPLPPTGESDEMYAVPHALNLPPVLLNDPPTLYEGEIFSYPEINSDGTWVAYLSDQDTDDVRELYSRQLDVDDDGAPDETDNCPRSPNPGQGAVVFGQDVLATSKTAFSWAVTADVNRVRGPLDFVDAYVTDDGGSLVDVVTYTDPAEPAPGAGLYYLFKPGGSCSVGSWQTGIGAEPARDASLP